MKKKLFVLMMAFAMIAVLGCNNKTDVATETPANTETASPSEVATPSATQEATPSATETPATTSGSDNPDVLSDAEIEEILAGSDAITLTADDATALQKYLTPIQQLGTDMSSFSTLMSNAGEMDDAWKADVEEASTNMTATCDEIMGIEPTENLQGLHKLLASACANYKDALVLINDGVKEDDYMKINSSITLLTAGNDHLTKATTYLQDISQ